MSDLQLRIILFCCYLLPTQFTLAISCQLLMFLTIFHCFFNIFSTLLIPAFSSLLNVYSFLPRLAESGLSNCFFSQCVSSLVLIICFPQDVCCWVVMNFFPHCSSCWVINLSSLPLVELIPSFLSASCWVISCCPFCVFCLVVINFCPLCLLFSCF